MKEEEKDSWEMFYPFSICMSFTSLFLPFSHSSIHFLSLDPSRITYLFAIPISHDLPIIVLKS